MSIFGKRKVELDEEQLAKLEKRILAKKKIRDLNPANQKLRQEPSRPWGKKERFWVGGILVATVLISVFLALRAREFKLGGLPRLNLGNLFSGETIVVGKKTWGQRASEQFSQKTKDLSGIYALYLVDLQKDLVYGVNENRLMQAASLIKLPLMLYADGKVPDAQIEAMGKRSDNNVFRELVAKFGQDTVQGYIGTLGMKNTSIAENQTTPKEIGDLFVALYRDQNEKVLGYLTDTIYEDWLKKGVPSEIRVAHKYGREVGVVNDAGIIFTPDPFVVVIMTQGVVEKEADAFFPQLAKMIYFLHEGSANLP